MAKGDRRVKYFRRNTGCPLELTKKCITKIKMMMRPNILTDKQKKKKQKL